MFGAPHGRGAEIAKAMMSDPAATATYCVPSNEYVIGEAFQLWFVGKLHRGLPVVASTAINAPPSSPKMTSPLASASVPPQEFAGPGCANSHTSAPVWKFIALRIRRGFGSVAVRCVPPRNGLPGSHSPTPLVE